MKHEAPTGRQLEVIRAITDHREAFGESPSISELCSAMDIRSKNGVAYHLDRLVDKGLVERRPGEARGLAVTASGLRELEK